MLNIVVVSISFEANTVVETLFNFTGVSTACTGKTVDDAIFDKISESCISDKVV